MSGGAEVNEEFRVQIKTRRVRGPQINCSHSHHLRPGTPAADVVQSVRFRHWRASSPQVVLVHESWRTSVSQTNRTGFTVMFLCPSDKVNEQILKLVQC